MMLILALVVVGIALVTTPLLQYARAQNEKASEGNAEKLIADLSTNPANGHQLAAAALERSLRKVEPDFAYYAIDYPGGDIPDDRGMAEDLIVRSYRAVGIDLQKEVHEDMKKNFRSYPRKFKMSKPDPNIDHRRVENLTKFFSSNGESHSPSRIAEDYQMGDVVVWRMPYGANHVGIVVPGPGARADEKWVVHNAGNGPVWENALFSYEVTHHLSYPIAE